MRIRIRSRGKSRETKNDAVQGDRETKNENHL